MSWNLNLYGHNNDPEVQESVLGILRAAGYSIDAITDYDGGDTFSGTFSGTDHTVSFPEPATVAADDPAAVVPDGADATPVDAGSSEAAEE